MTWEKEIVDTLHPSENVIRILCGVSVSHTPNLLVRDRLEQEGTVSVTTHATRATSISRTTLLCSGFASTRAYPSHGTRERAGAMVLRSQRLKGIL